MARQAMASTPRADGAVCGEQFIAIGALQALHAMGVRVQKIFRGSFDDLPPR
jgi:DNA-binding LacI/PurR family transcriptional regulator